MILKLHDEINGNPKGTFAFLVTRVDAEDSEMSESEFYAANGPAELKNLLLDEYLGDLDEKYMDAEREVAESMFDQDWETTILVKLIGNLIH